MKLNVIIPCYNEEEVIRETNRQLIGLVDSMIQEDLLTACEVLYVDDGSSDKTWEIIEALQAHSPYVHGVKLAHNVGHQNALWAGLEQSVGKCDAAVTIDADLQHDIQKIRDMVLAYQDGYEIVYGIRNSRANDTGFKKRTALSFYRLMQKMGVDLIPNHADFRLLGKNALHALMEFPERNLFLRGMVRLLGFKETNVYFDCNDRYAGKTKYTTKKMFSFALDGVTSFSVRPLRIITLIGVVCLGIAIAEMIYILVAYFQGRTIQGWASLLFSVWFLGGLLLFSIGVVGEYVGKIYKEVKRRPRYIIEKQI
ncbi:MAG: glycosyltransferase family 2 protein [Bacteroidales bacterium]|nr:glycosyltransferase family 2 protein [Bacteroidales bacterium]